MKGVKYLIINHSNHSFADTKIKILFQSSDKHFLKLVRVQRSGVDTIKYHTGPRIPMGKLQTHS